MNLYEIDKLINTFNTVEDRDIIEQEGAGSLYFDTNTNTYASSRLGDNKGFKDHLSDAELNDQPLMDGMERLKYLLDKHNKEV